MLGNITLQGLELIHDRYVRLILENNRFSELAPELVRLLSELTLNTLVLSNLTLKSTLLVRLPLVSLIESVPAREYRRDGYLAIGKNVLLGTLHLLHGMYLGLLHGLYLGRWHGLYLGRWHGLYLGRWHGLYLGRWHAGRHHAGGGRRSNC